MAKTTITMTDDNNNIIDIELDICAESKWEAIDYFIPCGECGNIVFSVTTKIVGDTHLCPVCAEKSKLDFDAIVNKAEDKFWETVASFFPNIMTGDLSILMTAQLHNTMEAAIKEWYNTNTPAKDTTISSPYKEFNELTFHFGQEWELEQTGGGTYVAYLLFYALDGEARRIGVSSECITIYDKPFTNGCVEDYVWFFGDNPTAFFCVMENYARHQDTFDFGKLFDDCQTIAKSGLV